MTGLGLAPSLARIVAAPQCVECDAAMQLTRIIQLKPGYELRSFECTNCDTFDSMMVSEKKSAESLHPQLR